MLNEGKDENCEEVVTEGYSKTRGQKATGQRKSARNCLRIASRVVSMGSGIVLIPCVLLGPFCAAIIEYHRLNNLQRTEINSKTLETVQSKIKELASGEGLHLMV